MGTSSPSSTTLWIPITLASVILMITMGIRQTVGLFVHPIVMETTMSIAEISMALAIGQLMRGAFQPLFGAWADKRGGVQRTGSRGRNDSLGAVRHPVGRVILTAHPGSGASEPRGRSRRQLFGAHWRGRQPSGD